MNCIVCGEAISKKVYDFSLERFKRPLCMEHQAEERKKLTQHMEQRTEQPNADWEDKIIPFPPLLKIANSEDWRITNELIQYSPEEVVFKSTITNRKGEVISSSHCDGKIEFTKSNNPQAEAKMRETMLRSTETKAMNRAIRLALGIWDSLPNLENLPEEKGGNATTYTGKVKNFNTVSHLERFKYYTYYNNSEVIKW